MLAVFGSLDGTILALSFLAPTHLAAGIQDPRENCSPLPVTVLGQSISVINRLPTIFNRCRRANCGGPDPAERENLAFLVEFYVSLLESL